MHTPQTEKVKKNRLNQRLYNRKTRENNNKYLNY